MDGSNGFTLGGAGEHVSEWLPLPKRATWLVTVTVHGAITPTPARLQAEVRDDGGVAFPVGEPFSLTMSGDQHWLSDLGESRWFRVRVTRGCAAPVTFRVKLTELGQ